MKTNDYEYFLQFDFKVDNVFSPIQFINPIDIISTYHLDEVNDCLLKINQAVNDGKYVAGYIGYEAAYAFFHTQKHDLNLSMPLLWFGVFHSPVTFNQPNSLPFTNGPWKITQSKNNYMKNFHTIMEELHHGVFDQVNYTVPFHTPFHGDSFSYYEQLKLAQQSKFNAFLKIGDYDVLSISPELFFYMNDNEITVKPMKGTIHRGKTYEQDRTLKKWLQNSEKNKRENELSTQLMKSELEDITELKSISFVKKYEIEQYPTVYQMTSTIKGEVSPNVTVTDILKHLFPSVSISGTPKSTAIDFIAKIETEARNVYCGAIGYITPNNQAIFNVPIRTVMINKKENLAKYHAGGAITVNSNGEEEYEEMLAKTKILHAYFEHFQLLETIGLHDGQFSVLELHLKRVAQSASYFNFKLPLQTIKSQLLKLTKTHQKGSWKVRLLVESTGKFSIDTSPVEKNNSTKITLAEKPINKDNYFLYHKTTNRKVYEEHVVENPAILDVLLWNENEEITEFTIGNVVVEMNGELFTPPVKCGLLPGTYRDKLLREGTIKEKIILKKDLTNRSKIWLINSVRHWVEVTLHH